MIQDAAYQSLLRSTRQQYHQQIAHILEARFPQIVDTQPELLAHHYTEASLIEQAIPYWQSAGQHALGRSANVEAIGHLTKSLDLLKSLPESTSRTELELELQITLGPALIVTNGYAAPEVEYAYARAYQLCQQIGASSQLFSILWGLCLLYAVRADYVRAEELVDRLLSEAKQRQDAVYLLGAYWAKGVILFDIGDLISARTVLEQGVALYDPQQHSSLIALYGQNPTVVCLSYQALTMWLLGYPEQATQLGQAMLTMAQENGHPHSLARALAMMAMLSQMLGQWQTVFERGEQAVTSSMDHGFALWTAIGRVLWGSAFAYQGQCATGTEMMRQGLEYMETTGSDMLRPHFLALLAEALERDGQIDESLRVVEAALQDVEKHGERWWEAELYRLKGILLQASQPVTPAENDTPETCFLHAMSVARHQQAKSLELRAAMSLCQLWQGQDRTQEAYDLLAPIYEWFSEGFNTVDLQVAKSMLDGLETGATP